MPSRLLAYISQLGWGRNEDIQSAMLSLQLAHHAGVWVWVGYGTPAGCAMKKGRGERGWRGCSDFRLRWQSSVSGQTGVVASLPHKALQVPVIKLADPLAKQHRPRQGQSLAHTCQFPHFSPCRHFLSLAPFLHALLFIETSLSFYPCRQFHTLNWQHATKWRIGQQQSQHGPARR